jgi:RNA polymerase sigma factor (TIGR02999 family)
MEGSRDSQITPLLRAWAAGDQLALDRLTPLVYRELHRIAHRQMRNEHPGNTLQTTALVNEAFLRLAEGANVDWHDRVHFFAFSAQMMRRILVDAARGRLRQKRGGLSPKMSLNEDLDSAPRRAAILVALDDALDELATFDSRKARVVELRYFGGLSVEETAEALKISPQSVLRDWKLAKAWLAKSMK